MPLHQRLLLLLGDGRSHLLAAFLQNRAGKASRRSDELVLSGPVVAVGSVLWLLRRLQTVQERNEKKIKISRRIRNEAARQLT